jgi:ribosomal protein S12 methylthiotransferase accessory factor
MPETASADRPATSPATEERSYKRYRRGTHRTVSPAQTLERIKPHMEALGVTRVANVTGLDRLGLPVVTVYRPNARSLAVSQGKGLDLAAAKASALMEAVETFHAEHLTLPLRMGSVAELARELPLVEVSSLPKAELGRFDPHLKVIWIEGRNWSDGASVWLPLETVSADYTLPLPPGSGCFAASTNGLASGNTLTEALCHGLCEVIERDAVTLWKLAGERSRRQRSVDLRSIDSPDCNQVLELCQHAGLEVRVWDVTSDLGVAAYCCLLAGDDNDWADPEFGAGCHPTREIALLRALTEAAQARATFIAGNRDDLAAALYAPAARKQRRAYCKRLIASHPGVRPYADTPTLDSEVIEDDVDWLLKRLRAVALTQCVVVDLSRAALGIPVVRVVVPGLEGPYGHEQTDYVPGARARAVMPLAP